jgi:hypothetical protein
MRLAEKVIEKGEYFELEVFMTGIRKISMVTAATLLVVTIMYAAITIATARPSCCLTQVKPFLTCRVSN